MTNTAFLFPGQGSQSIGMMDDLAQSSALVAQTFSQASAVLGYDLWSVVQDGPEQQLNNTETTQPALLAAGIATWRCWKEAGGAEPAFMAGHSLGEYTALVAAGAVDFEDAIALVAERGRQMQQAVPSGTGAMAAVLGMEDEALAAVCEQAAQGQVVSCANFNSPGQVVIAGDKDAVDRACELAKEAGARRAVPLSVSVPSHCALMQPAARAMEVILGSTVIKSPVIPVVHNVDTLSHSEPDSIRAALVAQLWQPVRWSDSVLHMLGQGVERLVECGPGKVLAGLNRRISRGTESFALVSAEDLGKAL